MYKLKISFHCWKCKRTKLLRHKSLGSGSNICKLCRNEYQTEVSRPKVKDKKHENPSYIRTEEERSEEARNNLKELTE